MDDRLARDLRFLGIDEETFGVLAMLPLVQVAWADGTVQGEERALISALAREHFALDEDARHLLEGWLLHPPSEAYVARAHKALEVLASERAALTIDGSTLADVIGFSQEVAKVAGGFLGFGSIDKAEAQVLEQIAVALHVPPGRPVIWDEEEDEDDEDTDVIDPQRMQEVRLTLDQDAETPTPASGRVLAWVMELGEDGFIPHAIETRPVNVGRSSTNDVHVQTDSELSRVHFRVAFEKGRYYVEDNQTTNGTWVNGERITRRRLYGGEEINAGRSAFLFRVA